MSFVATLFCILLGSVYGLGAVSVARAQEPATTARPIQIGFHTGPFMANGVSGVREIVPIAGVRFGIPFRLVQLEFDVQGGRGSGIEYNNGSIGARIDMEFEFVQYGLLLGGDYHYWKRAPNDTGEFSYRSALGWHTGAALLYEISPDLLSRVDFKLNFGPGTSLYVGLGLVFNWPDSGPETP